MVGEVVVVENRSEIGRDSFNSPVYETVLQVVENVLVVPGQGSNIVDSNRPDGHLVKYTLHFPKTFDQPLEGLRTLVRGSFYAVVGAPDHYTLDNTPGDWWMPVEVVDVHG